MSFFLWLQKRWFACVSIYPFFIGLLLAVFGIVRQQQLHKIYLEISFRSGATGITQVFWDTGNGFNQQDSVAASIRRIDEEKTVRFRLPESSIHQIRYDPNSSPGWFEIYRLGVVDGSGRKLIHQGIPESLVTQSGIGEITVEEDELSFTLTNSDPIFLLNYDAETLRKVVASEVSRRAWVWSVGIVVFAFCIVYAGYFLLGGWFTPLILAYINWQIFAPGVFSPDSLDQYQQALNNQYWNWHPPAMAILLHYLIETGLSLSQVIFFQVLCGFTGVYYLMFKLLKVFRWRRTPDTNNSFYHYGALAGFLILLTPLTPFAPFISTFWKDVWFAIAMIWIGGLSLHLFEDHLKRSRVCDISLIFLLLGLMILSILVRYNAILLIPAYGMIIYLTAKRLPVLFRWTSVILVVVGCLFSNSVIMSVFKVHRLEPKQSVMSLELVGLVVLYPDLLEELPYTKSQLEQDYRERFVWGGYRELRWNDDSVVKEDFVKPVNNPRLKDEYVWSIKHHPVKMTRVKLLNFLKHIDPRTTAEWCPRGIPDNKYGLEPNFLYTYPRGYYYRLAFSTLRHPVYRWISCVNLVWMILSFTLLVYWLSRWYDKKTVTDWFMVVLLTLAPLYYSSYLLASLWRAFRYMYPATLFTQIVFLALGIVIFESLIRRKLNRQ